MIKKKLKKIKDFNNEKIKFLYYGSLNTILSNIVLQILLLFEKISIATLISQILNLILGYFLYGSRVFGIKKFSKQKFTLYCFLALSSWQINWIIISLLSHRFNLSSNLSAIINLPIIAIWSYFVQKNYIFKKY